MKNDLTCEVVQDLLPSYVDHLTSDVTNTAIETHIRECADCRRILSDMQTPEPVPDEQNFKLPQSTPDGVASSLNEGAFL